MLCFMQLVIFQYEGIVRQFLVDDKGTVLIAAFGVPPLSHEGTSRYDWSIGALASIR